MRETTGGFPSQKPVARSFYVFFDLRLHKRLCKQSRRRWFETPSHYDVTVMRYAYCMEYTIYESPNPPLVRKECGVRPGMGSLFCRHLAPWKHQGVSLNSINTFTASWSQSRAQDTTSCCSEPMKPNLKTLQHPGNLVTLHASNHWQLDYLFQKLIN